MEIRIFQYVVWEGVHSVYNGLRVNVQCACKLVYGGRNNIQSVYFPDDDHKIAISFIFLTSKKFAGHTASGLRVHMSVILVHLFARNWLVMLS